MSRSNQRLVFIGTYTEPILLGTGKVAQEQGMITLRDDGWAKVRLGNTSVEEILRVVAWSAQAPAHHGR